MSPRLRASVLLTSFLGIAAFLVLVSASAHASSRLHVASTTMKQEHSNHSDVGQGVPGRQLSRFQTIGDPEMPFFIARRVETAGMAGSILAAVDSTAFPSQELASNEARERYPFTPYLVIQADSAAEAAQRATEIRWPPDSP